MEAYVGHIEKETLENHYFRKVVYTGPHLQLVVMTIQPGDDIGMEVHENEDQFIRVETGEAKCLIDGKEHLLYDDMAVVIPAGAQHNIINTSANKPLQVYTIYCQKHHPVGTIHETKADALAAEEHEGH